MPWKSLAIAAALILGAANMYTDTAFGRGMSGGGHFVGGGFAGHRFATNHGFVRRFRRSFATGGFWPYWPYYDYDYTPSAAYGDETSAPYPGTDGLAPEALSAPACHRSEEIVRVPSEGGGSREIKITRCP